MKKVSLKSLYKQGKISSFSEVRENENGYPYLTIILKEGSSQNLYFGQRSAENVVVGQKLTAEQLLSAEVVQSVNKNGDIRFKLSIAGATDYQTSAELDSIFDVEETSSIDERLFYAGFA